MRGEPAHVIVGAGLVGARAAQALRAQGCDERIVLIGDDNAGTSGRPALAAGAQLGLNGRAAVRRRDGRWFADGDIEVLLGRRVTALDRVARSVLLDDGDRVDYTKLLLATGAAPRRLAVPGADLDGVHHMRWVEDSGRLASVLRAGGQIVVVGGGWAGLETAAAAREHGCDVTVLESRPVLLQDEVGPELGAFFAGLHLSHGVDLRLGRSAVAFRGDGRVTSVRTDDGAELPADAVVVALGVSPRVELAERAGLSCRDGILVDESLRTADPHVFAAGDAARPASPFYGAPLRIEHWANAMHSAPVAAAAMLGRATAYDRLPSRFTDQYGVGVQFTGRVDGYDQLVLHGDVAGPEFQAFWLIGRRVVAAMQVNLWDDGLAPAAELIRSRRPVDPERPADALRHDLSDQSMSAVHQDTLV